MSRFLDQIRKAKEMRRQAGLVPPVGKDGDKSSEQPPESALVPEKQNVPEAEITSQAIDASKTTEGNTPTPLFPNDLEQREPEAKPTAKIIAASPEASDANLFPDELENTVPHSEPPLIAEPSLPEGVSWDFDVADGEPKFEVASNTPAETKPVSIFEQLNIAAEEKQQEHRNPPPQSSFADLKQTDLPDLIPTELSDLEFHGALQPTLEEKRIVEEAAIDSGRQALAEALERFEREKQDQPVVKPQREESVESHIRKIEAELEREWQTQPVVSAAMGDVADPRKEPVLERAELVPEMRPRHEEISTESAQSEKPTVKAEPVRIEISVPAASNNLISEPEPVPEPEPAVEVKNIVAEAKDSEPQVTPAPPPAPKVVEVWMAGPKKTPVKQEAQMPTEPGIAPKAAPAALQTPSVLGSVGMSMPRRAAKAVIHRRKTEPLFPPELETEVYMESALEDELEQNESRLLPDSLLHVEDEDEARRRKRRKVLLPGGQADPEFVKRVAKVALNPDKRVLAYYEPTDHVCEEYRLLGKNILHTFAEGSPSSKGRCMVLSSAVRGEGKTMTSVNLSLTISQDLVDRVLLVDGDMRHPKVHRYLGVPGGSGLNDLLSATDPASILDDCLLRTDMGLHLLLSTATGKNPAPLLDSRQMVQILNLLRERYSLIIIDTPPILLATDALTLGVKSDAMLFLMRARKTQREQIQEARQRIARLDIRLLGYVINNVKTFLPRIWSRYYYGNY